MAGIVGATALAAAAGSDNGTPNSNENFPDGNVSGDDINFDTGKLSINNPFDTKESQQLTFDVDLAFNPNVSGNLDIDLPKTNNNSSSNNTTYSNNSSEPTMTVDEVYGKVDFNPFNTTESNKQGDYSASSNEKSNIETSTFGKQDEVSVTPTSVTENKGMVGNAAIDSVEGLDFQQKDKEGQDVLDASKKRSEAEEEDRADSMRNKLKAGVGKAAQEEGGEDFGIGDRDEDVANAKAEVDRLTKEKAKYEKEQKSNAERLKSLKIEVALMQKTVEQEDADYRAKLANNKQLDVIGQKIQELSNRYQEIASEDSGFFSKRFVQYKLDEVRSEVVSLCNQLGVDAPALAKNEYDAQSALESFQSWEESFIQKYFDGLKDFSSDSINAYKADIEEGYLQRLAQYTGDIDRLTNMAKDLEDRQKKLQGLITDNEKKSTEAQKAYNNLVNETFVETPTSEAQKSYDAAMEAINNSKDTKKAAIATETLGNVEASRNVLTEAIDRVNKEGGVENASPEAIQTLMNAYSEYNKALKAADNKYKGFEGTDFSEPYAKAVVSAKNFDVTLADGSKQSFADYATEMATKSPAIAAAMYEAKAQSLEESGHTILARVERAKARIMKNNDFWSNLARPFLGADNKARAMFINMAKVNMDATYNANDNVLNNPNVTPERKAEAQWQNDQAKALMMAATALGASTGIGGWGDDMTDGEYGVTKAEELSGWQNFSAHVSIFAQALLGLGVTPAANKAYLKAYYLNPEAGGLLAKDFDGDGFVLAQEYGYNAAAQITFGGVELLTGAVLCFDLATLPYGINMITDAIKGMHDSLFGIKNASKDTQNAINTVLNYFNSAAETNGLPTEVVDMISQGAANIENINVFENFQLKSDEVGNLDNWLEGSGSNTATNEKFNQSLSYDEWLKLIESDDVMKDYAKRLTKNAKKDNVDKGVNA